MALLVLTGIPCTLMRGGTSKGLFFRASDLPSHPEVRNAVLRAAMGSPDLRQIDGVGGAHPLTSKIAIVSPSMRADADVDYLFVQVPVDTTDISDSQTCGNMLAAVGPWAIENGFVSARSGVTSVRVHLVNTGAVALVHVRTPAAAVEYEGDARIDGVPGMAAPVHIDFLNIAGSTCGALLPTGRARDVVDGVELTCIDNGMPVVMLNAEVFNKTGSESPAELEADDALKARIERIRLAVGPLMNLGDVAAKTVPKMTLIAPPRSGGAISTRSFIPHRVHEAIGVLGAVSVASACLLPGSIAADVAQLDQSDGALRVDVEHPSGFFSVDVELKSKDGEIEVARAALLRTARKLMKGEVFVPANVWANT